MSGCGNFDALMKYLLKEKKPNGFDLFQGIGEFIVQCTQTIGRLELLVHQIHQISENISSKLQSIESTNLFKFPHAKNGDKCPGKSLYFHFQTLWYFIFFYMLLCGFSC